MIGEKLTRGRYLRGAELTMTTNDAPRRRRWISLWALGAVIALASAYGVATASALESGDTVQVLIPTDFNPDSYFEPEDFLVYRSASGTVDARGCAVAGARPVQSATLVDRGGQDVGHPPTLEVITTYTTLQSHDVTTPVEPGTRVGNLLFATVCNIVVDGTSVAYTKYTGTVE